MWFRLRVWGGGGSGLFEVAPAAGEIYLLQHGEAVLGQHGRIQFQIGSASPSCVFTWLSLRSRGSEFPKP